MPELTVAYAETILLLRVSSIEQSFCQVKPEHKAFLASEGVKASRIQEEQNKLLAEMTLEGGRS